MGLGTSAIEDSSMAKKNSKQNASPDQSAQALPWARDPALRSPGCPQGSWEKRHWRQCVPSEGAPAPKTHSGIEGLVSQQMFSGFEVS